MTENEKIKTVSDERGNGPTGHMKLNAKIPATVQTSKKPPPRMVK